MKKQCSAYAISREAQCKNKAIPGSPYCWRHIAKIPLIVSAILALLSAIFGIVAFEFYRSIVPSDELQQLETASKELKDLREAVEPVMSMITKRYPNVETKEAMTLLAGRLETIENQLLNVEKQQSEELTELRAAAKELKELRSMVEPIINLAKIKYPKKDTGDAIDLLIERIQELEKQAKVIRSIEGTVECLISANWTKSGHPGTLVPISWNKAQFYTRIFENNPNDNSTILFSLNSVKLDKISDRDLKVKLELKASLSSGPFGQDLDALKKYSHMLVHIPFVHRGDTIDGKIILKNLVATLIINSDKKAKIEHADNFIIPLPESSKLPAFQLNRIGLFKDIYKS